jgi:hypothetical protein
MTPKIPPELVREIMEYLSPKPTAGKRKTRKGKKTSRKLRKLRKTRGRK